MTHKTCSKCKETKLLSEYYIDKKSKDNCYSSCKPCARLSYKTSYAKNKEMWNANKKKHYHDNLEIMRKKNLDRYYINRDKYLANGRKYYQANKEERIKKHSEWKKNNPEKRNGYESARRARKKLNGVYTVSDKFLKKLYGSSCISCGSRDQITIDHVVPIDRGGVHGEGNLQPLCLSCNSSKCNKTMMEWKLSMKFSRV